jgi:MtN3 and saliva related transmembrane protein
MESWILLGLVAGFFTTIGFVPQIVKAYRTKRMEDVSLVMPVLLSVGMLLWLFYGIYLNNLPIILWNAVALCLNLTIFAFKFRYKGKECDQPGSI